MKHTSTAESIIDYYDYSFDYRTRRIDDRRMARWLGNIPTNGRARPTMLDVGCGVGDTANWAKQRNIDWCGAEISLTAAELGNSWGRSIMNVDCQQMPFADNTFDIVTTLGSLEHFESPLAGLREIYRVLKPDGHAVVLVPSRPIIESLGLFHGTDQPHEIRLTRQEWHRLIEDAGFVVSRTRRDFGPPVLKNYKPIKIIQRLLVKATVCLPDWLVYSWLFDCKKEV